MSFQLGCKIKINEWETKKKRKLLGGSKERSEAKRFKE
jgi:hypothetical protein